MKLLVFSLLSLTGVAVLSLSLFGAAEAADPMKWGTPEPNTGKGNSGLRLGIGQDLMLTPLAATTLSESEKAALISAINEEYQALNLYKSVITTFGDVFPFSRIADSETVHANILARTMARYGVEVPQNQGLAEPPVFISIKEACAAGVDAEIADAALYDALIKVTTHADILRVFQNLQDTSLNNHLPAFQACQ